MRSLRVSEVLAGVENGPLKGEAFHYVEAEVEGAVGRGTPVENLGVLLAGNNEA